jgi:3-oxoacyl-[acyl-carrier protein] reductase
VSDTAIITGGGSGLGEAIARALHGAGYRVAVTDIDAGKAASVAEALDPTGKPPSACGWMSPMRAAIEAVACEIDKRWGGCRCWSTMPC